MNITHTKHVHTPSWDPPITKRKESATSNQQQTTNDSFFNRVFGHHSSDSSRAASPIPPSSNNTDSTTLPTKKTTPSRHTRNSSAGNIPSGSITPPLTSTLQTTKNNIQNMQRRRSFDGSNSSTTTVQQQQQQQQQRLKATTPTPHSSVSARVTNPIQTVCTPTTLRGGISVPKINTTSVPFPRGGRQIGASTTVVNTFNLRRSNSIERDQYQQQQQQQQPTRQKRTLFRFGKKKSNYSPSIINGNMINTATTTALTTNPLPPRKKSNDIIMDNATASDIQRYYYQQQLNNNERKKSNGMSGQYNRKGFMSNKEQLKYQNFDRMDGIVNNNNNGFMDNYDLESWAPPDSWGVVQPSSSSFASAAAATATSTTASLLNEDDATTEFEDYQIDVQEALPKKNANIKIYRPDKTYNTLHVSLNSTTLEILRKLATKFFMSDITKFNLVMKRQNVERILLLNERPLQIQKLFQEQMGYMEGDKIDDSTYLVRFQMMPNISQPIQEDKEFGQHVDLQTRSLPTIPIYLYKHASRIISLDISKNLAIEIPLDFIQMCTNLEQLWLANNEYITLPPSTQHISSLEHLNISGNRLQDLQHANLHKITGLRTLRAINNKLDSIPDTFSTNFKYLTTLYISNNSFTKFPMVICDIISLEYLDISFNKIQIFPDEIGQLTNLVGLFAIANRITGSLPASFMNLTKLQELDIRQNIITDLDVVSHLPRLEILLVDYNSTSIVNFEIKSLKQLKMYKNHLTQFNLTSLAGDHSRTCLTELVLSNCKLSSLPEDLFNNTQGLERLVLDSNTLNALPSSIGALKRLVRLSIQNNNLETLPIEIGKLSELKSLDAQMNNLKSLPKEIWLCASLQTLNCSSNLLESFPEPATAAGATTVTTTTTTTTTTSSTTSTPISDLATLEMMVTDEDDIIHMILPSTLNAGQGVIKRLDRLLDYNTLSQQSISSPVTPTMIDQPLHPTATTPASAQSSPKQSPTPTPPNFNPPSFFASPRNHPPPLSLTLRQLCLGDNRLTDDIWSPLSLFLELRTLNLSFNDLYEIPPDGLCHQHLYELYLSGNQLTSLPADDIEKLQYMRVLAINGNKLQTLPAEIGKLRKLLVLDVGNNVLKYNISNWPYDWNWNWNLGLKYLNLSGNKRLEIRKKPLDPNNPKDKDLSDFNALARLRMLGLMDITILGVSVPEEFHDRRVRTSPSEVNSMAYGVADWLGPSDHLSTWDLVMPRFRSKEDECIFALFDGSKHPKSGCRLTKQLNDMLTAQFTHELGSLKSDDTIVSAMRRVFLGLEQSLSTSPYIVDKDSGASAVMCYVSGKKMYVANVGDALAVISRNNGQAFEITQKHIPLNPSEISRIRAAGGHVSNSGLLNNELNVSRSFGHFHLIPVVNCNPFVSTIDLTENDEFVILASRGLWDKMTYQTAVDIARTEKDDLMAAAQKLRDFAITYGATDNLMVMVIGVGGLFDKREKRFRNNRGNTPGRGAGITESAEDSSGGGVLVKGNKRRGGKEEVPGDSTLARLEREVAPPTSQLALVFTDIKSSTQFWETQPENMRSAIKIHDAIMRRTLRSVGGYEVKTEGDAFMVCFKNITAALLWCFTVQLQLLEADWPAGILDTEEGREIEKENVMIYKGLSVRMGIHWGNPVFERNPITQRMDYFGPVVNKASRICNAADGGQICVSSDVLAALRNFPSMFDQDAEMEGGTMDSFSGSFPVSRDLLQLKRLGFHVVELGERRLKGLETPETLSLVYSKQLLGRIEVDKSDLLVTAISPNLDDVLSPEASTVANSGDYLTARPKTVRTIDPNLVCAMNTLAIRLERLTSGNSTLDNLAVSSGLGLMLERHLRQEASDRELITMMENCVARVENAVSSLYLQKLGRFANVLEKLNDAVAIDPMYIIKALQMFAEVSGSSLSL